LLQLLIAVIVLGLLFYGVAKLLGGGQTLSRSTLLWSMIAIAFVLLALTGRLGWLVPLIGAIVALLVRSAQVLVPLFPLLEKFWRNHRRKPDAETTGATGRGNGMTRAEALAVLGLAEGATQEEIIVAHRRLMQKVHPDRGGSDYLAGQLNKARSTLIH